MLSNRAACKLINETLEPGSRVSVSHRRSNAAIEWVDGRLHEYVQDVGTRPGTDFVEHHA